MRILQSKQLYLEQSQYAAALRLEKQITRPRAGMVAAVSGLGALGFLFLTAWFLQSKSLAWVFLGSTQVFASIFFLALIYWLFLGYLKRDHELSIDQVRRAWQQEAYGSILTFFSAQIVEAAALDQDLLLRPMFKFLLGDKRFLWVLKRLNISPQSFAQKVADRYPPAAALPLAQLLRLAWQKALGGNHLYLEYVDLLIAVYELDKIFQQIIFDYELKEEDLREVGFWQRKREVGKRQRAKFWSRGNLLRSKGIGKDWAGGFTVNLDKFAIDLTQSVKFQPAPRHLYGHKDRLEVLERMLVGGGNVVLVGEPGVGKRTLLRALAARINTGQTYGPLRYRRLLQIDSGGVIAGAASLNDVVARIQNLFGEALVAENVILVINDLDAFLDPHAEAGRVNATEALLPFFESRLQIIGLTTPQGYLATIGKNPQLVRRSGKLETQESSPKETLLILQDTVEALEQQSRLFFTYQALQEIVKLSTKLIQNLPNPEKSLEILEETATYVLTKTTDQLVFPEHVQKVVTLRTKVPVEKIAQEEKQTLLNLEEILHERIVGQHEAIMQIANALRRARSGIASEKRPIGSFLFLGPTGVGKTETTKALAAVYFGSEQRIIRFDMSEFQEIHALNRFIGDADTGTHGRLTEAVIANPFSLILLDELEKAHPKILDLFLQVFDEGRLTDALGRTIDFTNTMIIATSNAGAELIREMVRRGRSPTDAREEILDDLQRQGIFRPEFLNRFDAVIIFRPLQEPELQEVAKRLLTELNARLAEKDIQIKVTPELAAAVARGSFSPEFGARPLRRYIQENLENYLARGLISGKIERGTVVEINPSRLPQKASPFRQD